MPTTRHRTLRFWASVTVAALALVAVPQTVAQAAGTASLSGTVRAVGGGGAAGITVTAFRRDAPAPTVSVTSAAGGTFTVPGLDAGVYALRFWDPSGVHATVFTGDVSSVHDAGLLTVTLADGEGVEGFDQQLVPAAHLTGTVTDPAGDPVPDIAVEVRSVAGQGSFRTFTAGDGTYDVGRLLADTYTIRFVGAPAGYVTEMYDDTMVPDFTPVTVGVGLTHSGLDAVLAYAGRMTGTVRGPGGAPLAGVEVFAVGETWTNEGYDETDAAGGFELIGLGPDTYTLSFSAVPGVLPEHYLDALHPVDATGVVLGAAEELGGLEITLDAPVPFSDVPAGSAFELHISWLVRSGVATGYPDGTFGSTAPVTRQAMAAFLYRADGSPGFIPPATSPFADVATSDPFYREIAWLADQGIAEGTATPDGSMFHPGRAVSRQAMAAFLHRAYGSPLVPYPTEPPFSDVGDANAFYPSIVWLAQTGISTGTPQGDGTSHFGPGLPVSRQAMAAFLYRAHGLA